MVFYRKYFRYALSAKQIVVPAQAGTQVPHTLTIRQ
jgi:hypothetical protein